MWYPNQRELCQKILDWYHTDSKYMVVVAPTGTGKSLLSVVTQRATNERTHAVVSTIRLQDQMRSSYSFAPVLKGRDNYDCMLVEDLSVSQAPCQVGFKCALKNDCDYFVDRESAYTSPYAVFNYQLFMNLREWSDTFRLPRILFADEAHLAHLEIEKFMTATVSERDMSERGWRRPRAHEQSVEGMADWASQYLADVESELERSVRRIYAITGGSSGSTIRGSSREYKRASAYHSRLQHVERTLRLLSRAGFETENGQNFWVYDKVGATYQVRPVFVEGFSDVLFGSVPKVVLMSATMNESDVDRLGIDDYEMVTVGSNYSPTKRPVHYWPVGSMSRKSEDRLLPQMADRINGIIREHAAHGQKGVVHTVSYERAEKLKELLDRSELVLTHTSETKNEVIQQFKDSDEPLVLLSPSVQEGEDFPYDECRYVIIMKVMYLSLGDKVVRERMTMDPQWYTWKAVQDLIQSSGRGMRGQDDTCVVYILDQQFEKLVREHGDDMPEWFKEAVVDLPLTKGN